MATEYEQIKSAGIDPQVAELAEYHSLGTGRTGWLGLGGVTRCQSHGLLFEDEDKQEDTSVVFHKKRTSAGLVMMCSVG